MIDVLSDFTDAYEDFGTDAYINGATEPVKFMFDEDLDIDDSKLVTVRSLITTVVERADAVVMKGVNYKVSQVTPYGDQREENLISLSER